MPPWGDQAKRGAQTKTRRVLFTIEKANRALPLVRRIVVDIRDIISKLRALAANPGTSDSVSDGDRSPELLRERVSQLIEELSDIGVELKDFDLGLVDFPAIYEGREVCLCWKLGEPKVAWWHELFAGYAGRQPIVHSSFDDAE